MNLINQELESFGRAAPTHKPRSSCAEFTTISSQKAAPHASLQPKESFVNPLGTIIVDSLLFQVSPARTRSHCSSESGDGGTYFYSFPLTAFHNLSTAPSHR